MITLLASPKHFVGHTADIQKRAIASWKKLHPDVEIILYGDAKCDTSMAKYLNVCWVREITSTPQGIPFLDAIADHANRKARYDTQIYLNSDIILPPDLFRQLTRIDLPEFLVIGQRIDLAEGVEFDINTHDWAVAIRTLADRGKAELHTPTGVDYFIFKRGMWTSLPQLIIGRGGYDGALVAYCLRRGIPVIDATWAVPALHQYHDYSHVTGGLAEAHRGNDARQNYRLHDVEHSTPDISDADFQLRDGQLFANPCRGDWLRACEITLRHRWGLKYPSYLVRALWRLSQACGCNPTTTISLDELLHAYTTASRH